ncbi:MAG: hypothetical protein AABY18_00900 [Candidatus Thermoplasmatota archaeon]
MRAAVVCLVALLLAGCAQDEPPQQEAAGNDPSPSSPSDDLPRTSSDTEANATALSNFTFDQTFPLRVITGATGTTGVGDNGGNCVIFPTGIIIGQGKATLSWPMQVPTDLTVDIRVEGGGSPLSTTGASPVTLAFDSLPEAGSHPFDWGTFFMVHAGTVPVAVADVELHITFAYQAESPLEVQADSAACG